MKKICIKLYDLFIFKWYYITNDIGFEEIIINISISLYFRLYGFLFLILK